MITCPSIFCYAAISLVPNNIFWLKKLNKTICLLSMLSLVSTRDSNKPKASALKAIFHWAEFSARSDIFFCIKTNWRRVGVKRQKKISFCAVENSPNAQLVASLVWRLYHLRCVVGSNGERTSSLRFYAPRGFIKKFSGVH